MAVASADVAGLTRHPSWRGGPTAPRITARQPLVSGLASSLSLSHLATTMLHPTQRAPPHHHHAAPSLARPRRRATPCPPRPVRPRPTRHIAPPPRCVMLRPTVPAAATLARRARGCHAHRAPTSAPALDAPRTALSPAVTPGAAPPSRLPPCASPP
ncbi:lysine-rich arabinogalactan protein 19-like [Miscanthus floridulus]|uniref:lysine-rich arabinogalactan protein 19-like n=1 Tax=Miscanthus floridulus TaxID=154761 RepID=UPI0034587356